MHDHSHATVGSKTFIWAITLNLLFVLIEVVAGLSANSMALLGDAGHNVSDVAALAIAWAGVTLAARAPTPRHTYGFRRATILAALSSATLLLVGLGALVWESLLRFGRSSPVDPQTIVIVASCGALINGITAYLFMRGARHDVNLRAAFLHMFADTAVSAGVAVTGGVMLYSGLEWLDPAASMTIAIIVFIAVWRLFREALGLAVDKVPAHIDPFAVERFLTELPGVARVHDLHIWPLSTTEVALTAHLVMPNGTRGDPFLAELTQVLGERFGIHHPTIQIESATSEAQCQQAIPGSL